MLDTQTKVNEGIIKDSDDDIINKMADMSIAKANGDVEDEDEDEKVKEVLDLGNPVFKERRPISKIHIVLEKLMELRKKKDKTGDMEKAVVVSQWTSMLIIMKKHIEEMGLRVAEINGQVPVKDRSGIVNDFNRVNAGKEVMLLSLGAGGVGLNLIGGNHLFLLDMHWNPQLESQACDRIYRVGQVREVTIHRFLCEATVEARILKLQENKLDLAECILTGAKKAGSNKLTIQEMKQ